MPKVYAFYNPLAGNGSCKEDVRFLELFYNSQVIYCDLTKSETYEQRLFALEKEDLLILCGGDGTLNRFLNLVQADSIPCDILLFPLGTENRFAQALGHCFGCVPFPIRPQLSRLPKVNIHGRQLVFLSHIQYGFSCKAKSATVSVDGVSQSYKKVWQISLARNWKKDQLTLRPLDGRCRLFAKIRQGKTPSLSGQEITVTFSKPTTVYVDGDPVADITSYTATI